MATWKKIAFEENTSNFGSADQVQTDQIRSFKIPTGGTLNFTSENPPAQGLSTSNVPLRFVMSASDGNSNGVPPATSIYMNSLLSTNFETAICNFTATGAFLGITPLFAVQSDLTANNVYSGDDTAGPVMRLMRANTGATNQKLGVLEYKAKNSSGSQRVYSEIGAKISDATPGSEDGELYINLIQDGDAGEHAVLIKSRPTEAELLAGTPATPVFYTDSITLYGDDSFEQFSLRRRLINEIGVTTPFEVVFFPTTASSTSGTIPPGTETWGISGGSPFAMPSINDKDNKGVRYGTAQSTDIGDTFIRTVSNVGAMRIDNLQSNDMGGASWISCHHNEGVLPGVANANRIYTFSMAFFFAPSYASSGLDLDDDGISARIRIYQAKTAQAGGLEQPDPDSIEWELMGFHDLTAANFANSGLTDKFFEINFTSNNSLNRAYDLFIVTIENTGTLDLFDADNGTANTGMSVPFIKGEITRRVCNQLQHVVGGA